MDGKLLEILVCPQCKGALTSIPGGQGIACKVCQLKYPIRSGIPVMLVDEASDMRGSKAVSGTAPVVTFRLIDGPNKGMVFHLEHSTCKAIGRAISDPNKTTMFHVDVALSLDEGTKGLVQKYVSKQFKKKTPKDGETGSFKRTSDVMLDDTSVSRLHAMIFYDESGVVGVLDMVSKNGTFVNGEEVESHLLRKGDAIELGETKIVYEG